VGFSFFASAVDDVELGPDEDRDVGFGDGAHLGSREDGVHPTPALCRLTSPGQVVQRGEGVSLAAAELGRQVEDGGGLDLDPREPSHDLGGQDANLFLGPEQDTRRPEQGEVAPDGFLAGRPVVEHDDRSRILDGQREDRQLTGIQSIRVQTGSRWWGRDNAQPGARGTADGRNVRVERLTRENLLERRIGHAHIRVGRFTQQFQAIDTGQQDQGRCINDPHESAAPSLT